VNDEYFLQRCINLALNAQGNTYPNPLVGSVIVYQNKIIGEGYHSNAGEAHAEVNAINNVKDKSLLKDCTIYVSLEPCSHFGKTPPCSDLIIQYELKRVVIGSLDPNVLVAGKGMKKLQDAGIEVKFGVLEEACNELNKRFFHYHTKKLPYVVLKWAQTQNGFIDDFNKLPLKITDNQANKLVHQIRKNEDAILVGKNTLLKDNPNLNARLIEGKNPIPIILGWPQNIDFIPKMLELHKKVYVFETTEIALNHSSIIQVNINPRDILKVLEFLEKESIQSILVEGGQKVLQSFYDAGLWQELMVFESNTEIKEGVKSPDIPFKVNSVKTTLGNCNLFAKRNHA
jgi:diaminohydroxyphosphoribosylaminopyrimidine deaminase / 5-amino-6-(5-phosphoribosylamino)uracil reductase